MSNIIAKVGDKFTICGVKCIAVEAQMVDGESMCFGCIMEYGSALECLPLPDCQDNIIFVKEQGNE